MSTVRGTVVSISRKGTKMLYDAKKMIDLPVDEVTVSVNEGSGKSAFIGRDN